MPRKSKLRKLGDILLEMEPLMNEAMDHGLQHGEFLALMHVWLTIHRPGDKEIYVKNGTTPAFYYGPALKAGRPREAE